MTVAFLNKNTSSHGTTSSVSTSLSVTAGGTNVVAFAMVSYDQAAGMSVSSVTYGGRAMTSAGAAAHNTTSHAYVEIYYLVNPPTGANLLAFTVSGTIVDTYANIIAFQNVNQTTPIRAGTYATATGSTINPAVTVTSNVLDLTLSVVNGGAQSITGTNQTVDDIDTLGNYGMSSDHATTAASSVTHTWTAANATQWAIAGISINGTANGPTITAQPTQQTVNGGDSATFTVTATGTGVVHYQWKKNGSNVGTDSSSYNTGATVNTDTLSIISCVLTDDNGNTTSNSVYLLVNPTGLIW